MKQHELNATIRKTTGNGPARSLRRDGMFPAILYGPGTQPILLTVNVREFDHAVQKGNIRRTIFALNIQNGATLTKPAVIKEIQRHPVSGRFLHVDFYEIDMQRKLRVMVPIMPKGKAKGEEFGGMMQIIEREIEVFCLPGEIPDALELDVADLGIGDALHVKDIALPAGVELPAGVNYTVVTVVSQKAEAAPTAGEAEAGEAAEGEKAAEAEKAAE
ncbi:MAG: 50S ribosomal protein L25 [Desulfobacterales bacterium]|nr:50S ribosomal protein L25 [Desulfobacterales bacterium]